MDCPVRHYGEVILRVQDHRLLWDKAQSYYTHHKLKAVQPGWNSIRKRPVELPGLCQIIQVTHFLRFRPQIRFM